MFRLPWSPVLEQHVSQANLQISQHIFGRKTVHTMPLQEDEDLDNKGGKIDILKSIVELGKELAASLPCT